MANRHNSVFLETKVDDNDHHDTLVIFDNISAHQCWDDLSLFFAKTWWAITRGERRVDIEPPTDCHYVPLAIMYLYVPLNIKKDNQLIWRSFATRAIFEMSPDKSRPKVLLSKIERNNFANFQNTLDIYWCF